MGKPFVITLFALLLCACSDIWNSPHPPDQGEDIIYQSNFQLPPKHLDPVISYSLDESVFLAQIYEPPLGYHFLKRPYELEPVLLENMPKVIYLDNAGQPVPENSSKIAFTEYCFTVKPGVLFQPHPAFLINENGDYLNFFTSSSDGTRFKTITDFSDTATRELTASDFLYAIKRMADPANSSPMIGFMSQHIVGMSELTEEIRNLKERPSWLDLRQLPMSGLKQQGRYEYSITINGIYPQFIYWQAMYFFAPMPWEAERFYKNPGFAEKNLTLDWYPVGTGPFMMTENNPNQRIVLEKNPNFRDDFYPTEGATGDKEAGDLADAGKKLPMIDKAVFSLDKESLPMWGKFLQGYYDRSGESHGNVIQNFDQALVVGPQGFELSKEMADKNIRLTEEIKPSVFYYGFNMLDPVVGGYGEQQQKLRQAIAIAWNMEESIDIFQNGAGLPYMGPIPPGIDGSEEGERAINTHTHNWSNGKAIRKPIDEARKLLAEAGYPGGRDANTGKPLKLYFDVQGRSNSLEDWQKRQLEKLGIQLEFRATDWNRYREKMRDGNHQLFEFGWLADYPDPENFLYLLYGPESPLKCDCDGNNVANYDNPEYNRLFETMRTMQPGPERTKVIARMLDILRIDAPWFTGYYKKEFFLNNQWVHNNKRHGISSAVLKYVRIDPELRKQKQQEWNQPKLLPLAASITLSILLILAAIIAYQKRQKAVIKGKEHSL